jgi:hypothetical protein
MKHLYTLLAGAGLIAASGTIAAAEDGTTLFTPRLHGDHFVCSAINLSHKALGINIAVLDDTGALVIPSSGDANPTGKVSIPPGAEAELNFFFDAVGDGYCEVEVSGSVITPTPQVWGTSHDLTVSAGHVRQGGVNRGGV